MVKRKDVDVNRNIEYTRLFDALAKADDSARALKNDLLVYLISVALDEAKEARRKR